MLATTLRARAKEPAGPQAPPGEAPPLAQELAFEARLAQAIYALIEKEGCQSDELQELANLADQTHATLSRRAHEAGAEGRRLVLEIRNV